MKTLNTQKFRPSFTLTQVQAILAAIEIVETETDKVTAEMAEVARAMNLFLAKIGLGMKVPAYETKPKSLDPVSILKAPEPTDMAKAYISAGLYATMNQPAPAAVQELAADFLTYATEKGVDTSNKEELKKLAQSIQAAEF